MAAKENQIPVVQKNAVLGGITNGAKQSNPGLRALLSVKHFAAALESDYAELQKIEDQLHDLNLKAGDIVSANAKPELADEWKAQVQKTELAVASINTTLMAAQERVKLNEKSKYGDLWSQLTLHLNELKQNSEKTGRSGLDMIQEGNREQWTSEYLAIQSPLIASIVSYTESCRILMQMIERYSPDELTAITKIIADHVPLNFNYEQAMEYQNDYYKALINFKKEFKQEKNLWDKFLDILAGGTHQSPSERVMMERWLDGEKGDL